ncbi:MAG: hypothetical protein IKJ35_08950 [Clostridia bacterium]|nr:hypothetical protein [Clostridia bacterium]
MYEYIPTAKKKREFWTVAILSVTAAILFVFSTQPYCVYPALWQLTSVVLLVAVIMLVSNCLLREFLYRVAPREGIDGGFSLDFTVVECHGKRRTVVCRISVEDIKEIVPLTPENKKQFFKTPRGKFVYRYVSRLAPRNACRLTVRNEEEVFYLFIVADECLLEMLKKR